MKILGLDPHRFMDVSTKPTLRRVLLSALSGAEYALLGWPFLERILIYALGEYYSSKYRREWVYSDTPPHFFDQNISHFFFAYGREGIGVYSFSRGFHVAEILREGDRILDIGCGDGFFSKRFYSPRCARVDAVDIEPDAIQAARRRNNAANIEYHLLDAVSQPFPDVGYDVVVFDGAIGHFSPENARALLAKIVASLRPEGVFAGSESLGEEGSDHLQFFSSLDDLYDMFKPYFKYVELRQQQYRIGRKGEMVRREAYWRCANIQQRLFDGHWIRRESVR